MGSKGRKKGRKPKSNVESRIESRRNECKNAGAAGAAGKPNTRWTAMPVVPRAVTRRGNEMSPRYLSYIVPWASINK